MPRPSRKTDVRLIQAARRLVLESGLSGLRLREVARRAGVNLGMFHYHFGTKRAFVRRVLEEVYEDFFGALRLESASAGPAVDRLRRSLVLFGRFARDNRALALVLLTEVLRGHKDAAAFAQANLPRHVAIIAELIRAGQEEGSLKPVPMPAALSFAMASVGGPNLVLELMEKGGARRPFGRPFGEIKAFMLSDRTIDQRVDLVLAALRKAGGAP